MRVKAAVARAFGMPLELEGPELAEPRSTDILVRVVASGVGRLDRAAIDGELGLPLPFVPGSEAAGIVERIGVEVVGLTPGDSVFIDYASCGVCEACRTNHPRACSEFLVLNLVGRRPGSAAPFDGVKGPVNGFVFGQSSFATHVVCHAESAVKLPSEAPLEIAAGLGGEVLVGAAAIVECFRLRPGDTLAIVGADAAGLAACMLAKDRGAAAIIVADSNKARRHLASQCGATVAVHADEDLETAVRSLDADGAAFAFETTGRATARRACADALRSSGMLAVAQPAWETDDASPVSRPLHLVDRTVLARVLMLDLLDLHADGRFPIDRLIDFFPFPKVNEALEALADGSVVKPVLRFAFGAFDDLDRAKAEGAAKENETPHDASTSEERPAIATVKS